MPSLPRPHAFYLQLPPHHRAPPLSSNHGGDDDSNNNNNNNDSNGNPALAGLPYATIAAYHKSVSAWQLVKSLEIRAGLFCEQPSEVVDNASIPDGGDDDDDEEEPRTMLSLMKACTRLHTQLSAIYNLKSVGFTQYELCQIILKVLTLLSATVEVTVTDDEVVTDNNNANDDTTGTEEEVAVQVGVENMALDEREVLNKKKINNNEGEKKKRKKHVSVHFDDMGCIVGGQFTREEDDDGMLTILEDGRRVIDLNPNNGNIGNSNNNDLYTNTDTSNYLGSGSPTEKNKDVQQQQLERDLSRQLALPSPAREALLSVALLLLSKKDQLRSVSNTAIFHDDDDINNNSQSQRCMLILNWRSLLRMLLRTAPYLDEHKAGTPPMNSNTRTSTVLKRTVHLIRSCRKFFDQGIRPPNYTGSYTSSIDHTARALWNNLQSDLMYHSHSNSCFRALIMLYLFHPSKCSSGFYEDVMPLWMTCWRNVDRCPEYDFLWMVLFCRGRKYVNMRKHRERQQQLSNDECDVWEDLRKHLLTQAGYWLQIPVGGVSADKSFPRVGRAAKRSFPRSLKSFVGSDSKYEEGIEFVAKLSKLLMYCSGASSSDNSLGDSDMNMDSNAESRVTEISEGTRDILRFFSFVKPYFNPSNIGNWTFPLGAFLHYLSYELCHRIGIMAAIKVLKADHPNQAKQLMRDEPYLNNIELPGNEIVAYLDTLLPLCQASLYSKNGTVSHAGETAMLYLIQIDPARVSPPMLDFSLQALGVSSVNLSHQAPSALSALSRILQPALRHRPAVVLSRLPEMLQLTLAGIDSNDQNKTTRTLIFYRNLLMWIPCGGKIAMPHVDQDEVASSDCDGIIEVGKNLMGSRYGIISSSSYQNAITALPRSSVLNQSGEQLSAVENSEDLEALLQDAMMTMNDWSLSFLDRVFELLRAAGEQEKRGKGYAAAHTAADAAMTKNVSRILKETLTYFFASMDQETYATALRYVTNFISQETLPFAAKDASLLCQAVALTRFSQSGDSVVDVSPGLDALVPILTQDLLHRSKKSAIYRLRCLAGAIRYGGRTVLKHKEAILSALTYSICRSNDKELLKTGCKLLRHTLASQCEEYPISQWCHPMRFDNESVIVGASARLSGDRVSWCIPSEQQIEFCVNLLDRFALAPFKEIGKASNIFSLQQWRKSLRVLRYSLRGSIGLLLDEDPRVILSCEQSEICPREKATAAMLQTTSAESASILNGLRQKLCLFVMDLQSLTVTDTIVEDGTRQNGLVLSRDPKICSEVCELADLLLARRGAQHKSGSALSIWKGQKEIMCDFVLDSESNYIAATRSRSNDNACQGADDSLYFDGEDGGNTISRALLLSRMQLTMTSLADAASTQIPRRLRKQRGPASMDAIVHLFSLGMTYETLQSNLMSDIDDSTCQRTLEIYEGLIDGLCAMACHTNMNVRGNAIGIAEYAFTRYAWVIRPRISRLMSAFSLQDEGEDAKYGIVSCAQLVNKVNSQGKRMRLAEAIKGVVKLLGSPKVISGLLQTEANRFEIAQRLCTTQRLQSLLPHEELAKFTHYVTTIFLSIRSRHYSLPRATETDQADHEMLLKFLLDSLDSSDNVKTNNGEYSSSDVVVESAKDDIDSADLHWKNRLMVAWLLTNSIDEIDLMMDDTAIMSRLWLTCLKLIEDEAGQPIQRISVGLLGRLVSLALVDMSQASNASMATPDVSILRNAFLQDKFCRNFALALAYDHKEDSSVGGGHSAQWSAGVEEILRDAAMNLAPKSLYPLQRINQTSSTFNIKHCQMVEGILLTIGWESAKTTSVTLLTYGRELVAALPNEDQRNKLVASAELFGGICRALLRYSSDLDHVSIWNDLLIPFLDEAIQKMPNAFISVLFDAIRYGLHHFPPQLFLPLLQWCVSKAQGTLWQHENEKEDVEESGKQADRFSLQSTYLILVQAVLIELDSNYDIAAVCRNPWYTNILLDNEQGNHERKDLFDDTKDGIELGQSWMFVSQSLIPYLLNAIGHPYEKCRDQIASCLFRMCYCHGKFFNQSKSQGDGNESIDPGIEILMKFSSIRSSGQFQFKEKIRALGTARKFVSCCVHWGDAKHEFSQYLVPLLPLAFESLQPMEGEVSPENRGMEAELVKGYRLNLANMSTNCIVTYGSSEDMTRVLNTLTTTSKHSCWQIRQATAHFLQCFQGSHKFLLSDEQEETCMSIAVSLLADDRREVSSAAMSILTSIIAILPEEAVSDLVSKYIGIANKSLKKKKRKTDKIPDLTQDSELAMSKEKERATNQQKSVFFLCAVVMCRPYDVPLYVPEALAVLSKHSFEQRASLAVREVVKMCCSEFKRTHTDDWVSHKKQFTQLQLEALEDVVSAPHYYA